ncbi:hypothetical protein C8R43DRAFT_2337 [Mycena crocata]|nr:hypothetical protein C8R43DRAFT_2337 [Mycena crocata]
MLPAQPQIFYGREEELKIILRNFAEDSPRIAILGAGGMGKTSLARAALHHPDITTKYLRRSFVTCDSAMTKIELAALVGANLGLEPTKDQVKSVVRYFSKGPPYLLFLDNLETAWEPVESRTDIEEFLSLLTDVSHLALVITMRGGERPSKVRWSRPFLPPLKPLLHEAAHRVFVAITDDVHDPRDVDKLLRLTDNMPLAIDLIAHLADNESCASILARWETEKTALLSAGYDKRSNLDASIAISLSSPRMKSSTGARELLSLLSILPDGLSDLELLQSKLPIENVQECKIALLRTSLAYLDDERRLKSLVPIREHVRNFHPPPQCLIQPLLKHFHLLLELYRKYTSGQMHKVVREIDSNHGNLQQLLMWGLRQDNPDLEDTIRCTVSLNSFSRMTGRGYLQLMDDIPSVFPRPQNSRLEIVYITEVFKSRIVRPLPTPDVLLSQAIYHLGKVNDPFLESDFYMPVGAYYYYHKKDPSRCLSFLDKALGLARLCENTSHQADILNLIATITHKTGNYVASRRHAYEAERLAGLCGDLYEEARALRTEAVCSTVLGEYKAAEPLLSRAQTILERYGMGDGTLSLSIKIDEAQLHLLKSEYADAQSIHKRRAQIMSAEERPINHAFSLVNLAEIGVMMGSDEEEVKGILQKAKTIFNAFDYQGELEYCEMIAADLRLREGNISEAKIVFQESFRSSWGKDDEAASYCLQRLANIRRWRTTDMDWSFAWTVVLIAYAQTSQQKLLFYKALQFLGDYFLSNRDDITAENLFMVALERFTHMDIHRHKAECMMQLGNMAEGRGNLQKATELRAAAGPLFERSFSKSF